MHNFKTAMRKGVWERNLCQYLSSVFDRGFIQAAYVQGDITNNYRKMIFLDKDGNETEYMPRGNIIPPLEWKYLRLCAKSYDKFIIQTLLTDHYKQLEMWNDDIFSKELPGEVTILLLQINRTGGYALFKEIDAFNLSKVPYIKHVSRKSGAWIFAPIDVFLAKNKKIIKNIAINGVFKEENTDGEHIEE